MDFSGIGRGIRKAVEALNTLTPEGRKEKALKEMAWESLMLLVQQEKQESLAEYRPETELALTKSPFNPGAIIRVKLNIEESAYHGLIYGAGYENMRATAYQELVNREARYLWCIVVYHGGDEEASIYYVTLTLPESISGDTLEERQEKLLLELISREKATSSPSLSNHTFLKLEYAGKFSSMRSGEIHSNVLPLRSFVGRHKAIQADLMYGGTPVKKGKESNSLAPQPTTQLAPENIRR
jgi:hypothetical protein